MVRICVKRMTIRICLSKINTRIRQVYFSGYANNRASGGCDTPPGVTGNKL